jgi:glutathione peroxidase
MKRKITVALIGLIISSISKLFAQQNFHSYSAETILGDTISLSNYYGKKVMVVNTASFCGYTPQFAQLEQLYLQYQSNNFEIIGFPCNNFGNQDPHSDSAIFEFCTDNYNVTFQMMSRVDIVVGDTAPVYKWLQRSDLNGVEDVSVAWNFNKFLIDEQGNWVEHYLSQTLPNDSAIVNWILSPPPVLTNVAHQNQVNSVTLTQTQHSISISGDFVESNNINVFIYDLSGKELYSYLNQTKNSLKSLSINDLNNGLYFAKIMSGNFVTTKKFIVRK